MQKQQNDRTSCVPKGTKKKKKKKREEEKMKTTRGEDN